MYGKYTISKKINVEKSIKTWSKKLQIPPFWKRFQF